MQNAKSGMDPKLVDLVLNSVVDGVFAVDPEFRITYFNNAAQQITGYSAKEAVGMFCSDVFRTPICHEDCPLRKSIRTNQQLKNFDVEILTKTGKRQTVNVSTAPLLDENGAFLGGVETFRDLSPIVELRRALSAKYNFQDIVSKNTRLRQILDTLPNIAKSDATVLIQGSSGTGKQLLATAIHNISPRASYPLVQIKCNVLPEDLLDSELFGRAPEDDVVANKKQTLPLQATNGGTLFLNEIGDLSLSIQTKLMRMLEHSEIEIPGTGQTVKIDVRLIASTKHNLERLVEDGQFREDLYYRLNVLSVRIPDLRERTEDIPLLVDHFIQRFNHRLGRNIRRINRDTMAILMKYPFPGNVRELENAVEHACVVVKGSEIDFKDLPPTLASGFRRKPAILKRRWGLFGNHDNTESERHQLTECLRKNSWSIPRAARELGIHRTTLWRKVKRLNIYREQ